MGQIGTPFTSASQAIGMTTFFAGFTGLMGYLTYDCYQRGGEDFKFYAATCVMSVAMTGLAINNACYYFFDE